MKKNRLILAAAAALFLEVFPARADPAPVSEDDYLKGYITAVIDSKFGWDKDTFTLRVEDGAATLMTLRRGSEQENRLRDYLRHLPELKRLTIEEVRDRSSRLKYLRERTAGRKVIFPMGDLFHAFLADPKQPQFFVSFLRYDGPIGVFNSAAVGYGENFGLFRIRGEDPTNGVQVSLNAGLFGQFDLDTESRDLINSDYTAGLAVSQRRGRFSSRLRVYHQSSHLGDEFLISHRVERVNLAYESVELMSSLDWRAVRAYAGGEYLYHLEPEELRSNGLHYGLEYEGTRKVFGFGRLVGGVDLKNYEENHWSENMSGKIGFELGSAWGRYMRIMLEGYKGFSPHGQFYRNRVAYYGIGIYLGF